MLANRATMYYNNQVIMKLKSILLIALVATMFASCGKKAENTAAAPAAVETTEVAAEPAVAEPLPLVDLIGQLQTAIEEEGNSDKALEIFQTINENYPANHEAWAPELAEVYAEWIMGFYDIASTEQLQKYEEMIQ